MDKQNEQLNQWDETQKEEISVEYLDSLVAKVKERRDDYDEKKRVSTEAYHKRVEAEEELLEALRRASKSKYSVDGIGTVSQRSKLVVKLPKEEEAKRQFFEFLKESKGDQFLDSVLTINHNSLNALYNSLLEENPELKIPGLEEPTHQTSLVFSKERKK